MDFNEYLDGMSKIQNSLLEYVENDQETDQNLIQLINEYKISNNKKELKQFIHIFMQILNNHHRQHDFYDKVFEKARKERLLLLYHISVKLFFLH